MSILDDSIRFSNSIEYLDLNNLKEIDTDTNFFSFPDNESFLDLVSSIEIFGVLYPLIVMRSDSDGDYDVICGRNRLLALRSIYKDKKDQGYFKVPCIILERDVDPLLIQGIIVSTNLSYRKLSLEDRIKSVFILNDILVKNKKHKNEYNVASTIAKKIGITRNTVNSYMELKGLSKVALGLVYKKHMNLKIAKLLVRQPHEKQDEIIKILKNDINNFIRVKALVSKYGPQSSILDEKTKTAVPITWERQVEFAMNLIPQKTTITITVEQDLVEEVLEKVLDVKKNYIKHHPTKNGNKCLKIGVNQSHMEQYLKRGIIKKEVYKEVVVKKDDGMNNVLKSLLG